MVESTWVYDPDKRKRLNIELDDDIRRGKFHSYAQAVATLPKGEEFVNAAPDIVKDDETAKRYNEILGRSDVIKPHKQITETWARHCTPTEDLGAEIESTGQQLAARIFNRIDQLSQRAARFAKREPLLPFRAERPILRSRLQSFRRRLSD